MLPAHGDHSEVEGNGRVPHVRLSVRGPKTMGAARPSLSDESPSNTKSIRRWIVYLHPVYVIAFQMGWLVYPVKSHCWASPIFFGPRTLGRTWGTRPISSKIPCDSAAEPGRRPIPARTAEQPALEGNAVPEDS
jgi:hypothetical protein